jgi:hypothetical protein
MQNLLSWWDSYQALSTIGTVLKCLAALLGVLILVFGLRESSLRGKAQAAERATVAQRIEAAEAAAKHRRLSPEQKQAIIGRLKAIPERQKIFISASVLDAEALQFAEDIESVFLGAGFEVHLPKGMQGDASLMVGPPGLHLVVKDPKSPFPLAAKIQRTFMDSGIEIPGLTSGDSQFETNRIEICVGQK